MGEGCRGRERKGGGRGVEKIYNSIKTIRKTYKNKGVLKRMTVRDNHLEENTYFVFFSTNTSVLCGVHISEEPFTL